MRSSEIEPTDFGIADDLEAYGEMVAPLRLLPVVGVWVERARSASSALKKAVQRRREEC